ncbi:ATP-grasp domain-containing protein [Streptomyces sp. NPDC001102]
MSRPVIAVVYDFGSVSPVEAVERLEPLGDVVFAVVDSPHTADIGPLLAELAPGVRVDASTEHGLDAAAAELRRHAPTALLTFSERRLDTTAALAVRLGLPGHTPDTVRLLTDKHAQRRRLAERGVDRVRSHLLRSPADWTAAVAAVGLPAVLKPVRGEGSRSTHLVREAAAGAALAQSLLAVAPDQGGETGLVLEEYLAGTGREPFGDHVSVESAVVDGRVTHWAVTGKFPLVPPFREAGHFWPAPLDADERAAVLDLAARAVRALDVRTGITHTELKLTPHGPRVIEVNGRLGACLGGLSLLAGGPDCVALAARVALGEDPFDADPHPAAPARDVTAAWMPQDRVVYARAVPTPVDGGLLTRVNGIRDVLGLPGVQTYDSRVRPGSRVSPDVRTAELALLWGTAGDHAEMVEVLDRALTTLTYTFDDPATGAPGRTLCARDLGEAPAARRATADSPTSPAAAGSPHHRR